MADTTGNINDKEGSKFEEIGAYIGVKQNEIVGSPTVPSGTVNDLANSSLINSGGEVLVNILSS